MIKYIKVDGDVVECYSHTCNRRLGVIKKDSSGYYIFSPVEGTVFQCGELDWLSARLSRMNEELW